VKSAAFLLALTFSTGCSGRTPTFDPRDPSSPLQLVRTIELPNVNGRIDHLALDADGRRLFIAENENGSVDEVDLSTGKVVGRISGLHEPQGVAWLPAQREIAVASADGLVTFYRATDRQKIAIVNLGSDADNVRVDPRNGDLVVGYGSGGLAVIDPVTNRVIGRVPLPAHPEAFEMIATRVFVNVPGAHKIVMANLDRRRVSSQLDTSLLFGNYPMGSNSTGSMIAVAYRAPATVSVLDSFSGAAIFSASICGDADDLYFRLKQLVIVCGSGVVELINLEGQHDEMAVTTREGARTGLLDGPSDHLFVAVPARQGPAAIWEFNFR
jgi:hypothetical protein